MKWPPSQTTRLSEYPAIYGRKRMLVVHHSDMANLSHFIRDKL